MLVHIYNFNPFSVIPFFVTTWFCMKVTSFMFFTSQFLLWDTVPVLLHSFCFASSVICMFHSTDQMHEGSFSVFYGLIRCVMYYSVSFCRFVVIPVMTFWSPLAISKPRQCKFLLLSSFCLYLCACAMHCSHSELALLLFLPCYSAWSHCQCTFSQTQCFCCWSLLGGSFLLHSPRKSLKYTSIFSTNLN
jgi:hypothetical protein